MSKVLLTFFLQFHTSRGNNYHIYLYNSAMETRCHCVLEFIYSTVTYLYTVTKFLTKVTVVEWNNVFFVES